MFKSQINFTSFDGPPSVENALGTDNRYFDTDISTGAPDEILEEESFEAFQSQNNRDANVGYNEELESKMIWEGNSTNIEELFTGVEETGWMSGY
ncbi:unnamed protein product [Dovyalis caffra]|uniref:Uncharacterized protein n=1 Tax=Dovyalis caffra TaxID=77055 RepID=A0AAV1S1R9_9ROSI|nr:unnamed protein product [Dovyalis caffra]